LESHPRGAKKKSERLKGKGFDLVMIDSIYTLLGSREENSNEDISELGSWLHKLAKELDVAVVFTHHFSKGQKTGMRGLEKSSEAGAWGRFVDFSLAIDQHSEEGCFNFEPDLRTFEKQSAFVARRRGSIWKIATGLKVEHKQSGNSASLNDILQILDGQELSPGEWKEQACDTLKISARTFDSRKKRAEADGLIDQTGKGKATVCKLAKNVAKNPETGKYEPLSARVTLQGCKDDPEQPF
jgi:hypothetical protein